MYMFICASTVQQIFIHVFSSIYLCRHSLVPIVPAALLDYVQLPSTYIMGIHSSLKRDIGELVSEPPDLHLYIYNLENFFGYTSTCNGVQCACALCGAESSKIGLVDYNLI